MRYIYKNPTVGMTRHALSVLEGPAKYIARHSGASFGGVPMARLQKSVSVLHFEVSQFHSPLALKDRNWQELV
jgi:hypothetical protein